MEALKTMLKGGKPGGVFWYNSHASPADVARAASGAKLAYFHIEGQMLMRKEQFLNHAAVAMHFPDWFGDNWDAFEDCLTDLSWVDADGYVILYDHTDLFAEHAPQHFDTLIEIFKESADFWAAQGKRLYVLLRGKHPVEGLEPVH